MLNRAWESNLKACSSAGGEVKREAVGHRINTEELREMWRVATMTSTRPRWRMIPIDDVPNPRGVAQNIITAALAQCDTDTSEDAMSIEEDTGPPPVSQWLLEKARATTFDSMPVPENCDLWQATDIKVERPISMFGGISHVTAYGAEHWIGSQAAGSNTTANMANENSQEVEQSFDEFVMSIIPARFERKYISPPRRRSPARRNRRDERCQERPRYGREWTISPVRKPRQKRSRSRSISPWARNAPRWDSLREMRNNKNKDIKDKKSKMETKSSKTKEKNKRKSDDPKHSRYRPSPSPTISAKAFSRFGKNPNLEPLGSRNTDRSLNSPIYPFGSNPNFDPLGIRREVSPVSSSSLDKSRQPSISPARGSDRSRSGSRSRRSNSREKTILRWLRIDDDKLETNKEEKPKPLRRLSPQRYCVELSSRSNSSDSILSGSQNRPVFGKRNGVEASNKNSSQRRSWSRSSSDTFASSRCGTETRKRSPTRSRSRGSRSPSHKRTPSRSRSRSHTQDRSRIHSRWSRSSSSDSRRSRSQSHSRNLSPDCSRKCSRSRSRTRSRSLRSCSRSRSRSSRHGRTPRRARSRSTSRSRSRSLITCRSRTITLSFSSNSRSPSVDRPLWPRRTTREASPEAGSRSNSSTPQWTKAPQSSSGIPPHDWRPQIQNYLSASIESNARKEGTAQIAVMSRDKTSQFLNRVRARHRDGAAAQNASSTPQISHVAGLEAEEQG